MNLTDNALKTQVDIIRNETTPKANTAPRVANMYQNIIDSKISGQSWVTATAYSANISFVIQSNVLYKCLVSHTSGTFATDLASNNWVAIGGGGGGSIARTFYALTISASTTLDATSSFEKNFVATSVLTTVAIATPTNLNDGDEINIDLSKTTATNAVYTFSAAYLIITDGIGTSLSGQVVTLISSSSGRYFMNIKRSGSSYFISITRVLA